MKRGGFTLLEIVVVVISMAAMALIGTRLITTSMRSAHDATGQRELLTRFDSAMTALRSDALHAEKWTVNEAAVEFDGRIRWTLDLDGLNRIEGDSIRKWPGVKIQFRDTASGLEIRPVSDRDAEPLVLISASRWLSEVSP